MSTQKQKPKQESMQKPKSSSEKITVTSLEEIRQQAEPDIITISGFRPGTTINVAVRIIDLTPFLLSADLVNPIYDAAIKKASRGKDQKEIVDEIEDELQNVVGDGKHGDREPDQSRFKRLMPQVDAACKEALVRPTYDEITSIAPLSLQQKMEIFDYVAGGLDSLKPFRS